MIEEDCVPTHKSTNSSMTEYFSPTSKIELLELYNNWSIPMLQYNVSKKMFYHIIKYMPDFQKCRKSHIVFQITMNLHCFRGHKLWIILAGQHIITLSKHGSVTGNQCYNNDNRKGKVRVNFPLMDFLISYRKERVWQHSHFSVFNNLISRVYIDGSHGRMERRYCNVK